MVEGQLVEGQLVRPNWLTAWVNWLGQLARSTGQPRVHWSGVNWSNGLGQLLTCPSWSTGRRRGSKNRSSGPGSGI